MNKTNQYASAVTTTTPSPFDLPLALITGELFFSNKSTRRKIRKLVAKGNASRESLPLSAESNNILFAYLRPLSEKEITATYRGEPFNLSTLPEVPSNSTSEVTSSPIDPSESIATPAPMKKAKAAPKAKTTKTTVKKAPASKKKATVEIS